MQGQIYPKGKIPGKMLFLIYVFVLGNLCGQTLPDEEADQIVAEEVAQREAARPPKPDFTIIKSVDRSVGNQGIIFHKVMPPELKEIPSPEIKSELSAEELIALQTRIDGRPNKTLSLGIQVFDNQVSELIWRDEGQTIRIWSNINFSYLTPIANIETDHAVYSLVAMISKTTTEEELQLRERFLEAGVENNLNKIPDLSVFSGSDPEYIVFSETDNPVPDELLQALDALHLYYFKNERELKNAALRRQSLAAARKRYEAANPKKEEPTVVHYWKVEQDAKEDDK